LLPVMCLFQSWHPGFDIRTFRPQMELNPTDS
jgi:hypothetical protein